MKKIERESKLIESIKLNKFDVEEIRNLTFEQLKRLNKYGANERESR